MTPEQLEKVRERFLAYVESFGTDEGLHPMMKLKRAHTLRVARLAREIAAEMGWSGEDVRLAEAAGVLHDVGRFTQYRDHATYNDARSVDHGERGWQVLRSDFHLDGLDEREREAVGAAVRYHNRRDIPQEVPARALPFVQTVRDADKLDVLSVVRDYTEAGRFTEIYSDVAESGPLDEAVVAEIGEGVCGSASLVRTRSDLFLVQMSWAYDMNHPPAFARLLETGVIGWLASHLPDEPGVREVVRAIESHVRTRAAARG